MWLENKPHLGEIKVAIVRNKVPIKRNSHNAEIKSFKISTTTRNKFAITKK